MPFWNYGQVTATDAASNQTTHSYFTTGKYCCSGGATTPDDWKNELLTGREFSTTVKDANNNVWWTVATMWLARSISNTYSYPFQNPAQSFINFVYPLQVATTLRDGSQAYTQRDYDDHGNQIAANNFVGTPPANPTGLSTCDGPGGCVLSTSTPYVSASISGNSSVYIYRRKYVSKTDPKNNNAVVSCSRFYYDGAKTAGTLATDGSAAGLLTATSTAITTTLPCATTGAFTTSTNTYYVYDGSLRVTDTSVPYAYAPESQLLPPDPSHGWIPSGVAKTHRAYNLATDVDPGTVTDPMGLATATTYNTTYGKPDTVTEPSGHKTQYSYDAWGRLQYVYDNFDSANPGTPLPSPTTAVAKYTYVWGLYSWNKTLAETYVDGTSNTRYQISCLDGFGRTIETREYYRGASFSSVRTDYDSRGNKAVVTNAVDYFSSSCPATPPNVTARDRTAYTYDPLGNVATTMSIAANNATGPYAQADHNGNTTTLTDERFNVTTKVADRLNRTLTAIEPAAPTTTVVRPARNGTTGQSWSGSTGPRIGDDRSRGLPLPLEALQRRHAESGGPRHVGDLPAGDGYARAHLPEHERARLAERELGVDNEPHHRATMDAWRGERRPRVRV